MLLGAGAISAAATLGIAPGRSFAQDSAPQKGGTFRLAISDFDTGDTLEWRGHVIP